MRCKVCGKPVVTGIVLHEGCMPRWRIVGVDPDPETHTEVLDDEDFEYQVSDYLLCKTADGAPMIGRYDPSFGWFCEDGRCPKIVRWMPIPD